MQKASECRAKKAKHKSSRLDMFFFSLLRFILYWHFVALEFSAACFLFVVDLVLFVIHSTETQIERKRL